MSSSKRIPALLFCLLIIAILSSFIRSTDAARFCYSGQNSRFAQKHCSSGSMDLDYVCQKYTCEGGRSPFVLRTCALKTTGCLAGPRICKFSGGKGRCDKCDGDLLPFIFRDCSLEKNCALADELCDEYDGNGSCFNCSEDFCNEQGLILNKSSITIVNGGEMLDLKLNYIHLFTIFIIIFWQ